MYLPLVGLTETIKILESFHAPLISSLYAKQTKGVMFLRIEDTDHKREIENGPESIVEDFKNLEIDFDEGYSFGGEYGPYLQSERKDIYQAFANFGKMLYYIYGYCPVAKR